jgi:arginase
MLRRMRSRGRETRLAVLGAPSNLGLKPYDDGHPRRVNEAPRVYRELGLVERLGARDLGDVEAPPYRDFERPPGIPRNEREIAGYSRDLAERVSAAVEDGAFTLVLGGDCSILLGTLLGLRSRGPCGLAFVDGHFDFADPSSSESGGAAGMDLALAVGRGGRLARLAGPEPLVRESDAVSIGRKDPEEPQEGPYSLRETDILDLPYETVRARGTAWASAAALERLARPDLKGFWIHFDADVLDPAVMPAVDSPAPGGFRIAELADLLTPLVQHPHALGLQVTIYDPGLDPDRACASRMLDLFERILQSRG